MFTSPLRGSGALALVLLLLLVAPAAGIWSCGGHSCARLCSNNTATNDTTTTTTTTTVSPLASNTSGAAAATCGDGFLTQCKCDCLDDIRGVVMVDNCHEERSIAPVIVVVVGLVLAVAFIRLFLWKHLVGFCGDCGRKCDLVFTSPYSCCGHFASFLRARWYRARGMAPTGPILLSSREGRAAYQPVQGAALPASEAERKRKEAEAEGWCTVPVLPSVLPFAPIDPSPPHYNSTSLPPPAAPQPRSPNTAVQSPQQPQPPSPPASAVTLSSVSTLATPPAYGDGNYITFEQAYHMARQQQPLSVPLPAPQDGSAVSPLMHGDRPPAHASRTRASLTRAWHEPSLQAAPRDEAL